MSQKSRWDYLKAIYTRYHKVSKELRARILDEFCQVCGYNRKYAIRLLNGPAPQKPTDTAQRHVAPTYGAKVISCSVRHLGSRRLSVLGSVSKLCCLCGCPGRKSAFAISAQAPKATAFDQPLHHRPAAQGQKTPAQKKTLRAHQAGHACSKHHIPIKTDSWDVTTPALPRSIWSLTRATPSQGEFVHSLNVTDIHSTWVESRAVMGKGQDRSA